MRANLAAAKRTAPKLAAPKRTALCVSFLFAAIASSAQTTQVGITPESRQPDYASVYCSGFLSDPKIPDDIRVISGEQSSYKIVYAGGDFIYLNRGADKGVKIGDRFTIVRPDTDIANEWFYGQPKLFKEMGVHYLDAGQVRVVDVQPKISIAQVVFSCSYLQRGDIARPFEDRPVPPYKDASKFEHFAPVSGKPVGTVVSSFDYHQLLGRGDSAYVNIGAAKGVKVGDYIRVFRYQETKKDVGESAGEPDYQYKVFGFGTAPAKYKGKDLPREVLGEGIVLNVTRNAATVLITYSMVDIYTGDYAELE
jgi:hypothetical protein